MMKRENGFTLVEVVASLVIIGIVLLSVGQLMIQSNKAASTNNEKLVAIDLADTILQRLKAESYLVKDAKSSATEVVIKLPDNLMTDLKTYTTASSTQHTIVKFNEQQYYEVRAFGSQCPDSASSLNIVNVRVEAQRVDVKIINDTTIQPPEYLPGKSEIEGYVEL